MPARGRILVTNWSVHSQSARELVTDLFRRQAADSKLTRGEALRQAMMALIDGKGFTDEKGKTLFSLRAPAVLGALQHHRRRRLTNATQSLLAPSMACSIAPTAARCESPPSRTRLLHV